MSLGHSLCLSPGDYVSHHGLPSPTQASSSPERNTNLGAEIGHQNFVHDLGLLTLPENPRELPRLLNSIYLNSHQKAEFVDRVRLMMDEATMDHPRQMATMSELGSKRKATDGDAARGETSQASRDGDRTGNGNRNRPQEGALLGLQRGSSDSQMHSLSQELQSSASHIQELERERACINSKLVHARKRQKIVHEKAEAHKDSVQSERRAAGISDELWQLYQIFCEALPAQGYSGHHSFAWNKDYGDSYIKYDPAMEIFESVVDDAHKSRNWRCEGAVIYSESGVPTTYQVHYYPLPMLKGEAWETRWANLHRLAIDAAKQGSAAALDMLVSLPDKNTWFGEGWLFEFGFKEHRRSRPTLSQRWTFRASHNVFSPVSDNTKRARLIAVHSLPFTVEKKQ
ncbi:hypothetical protein EKO27_g1839 [Xylaria grammica]|uniref:Uncharacterized protein n=1 Tax=Xylaria grammica TaxID=363999 RepID=A0A439DFZ3_9PEZI|nr:hypothetical protein EKO27_g1839 [Xylaria grammica]